MIAAWKRLVQRANLFPMYAIPICVSSWKYKITIIIQTQSKEKAHIFLSDPLFREEASEIPRLLLPSVRLFFQTRNHDFALFTWKKSTFQIFSTHGKVNPISLPNRLSYWVCAADGHNKNARWKNKLQRHALCSSPRGFCYGWLLLVCLFCFFNHDWMSKGYCFNSPSKIPSYRIFSTEGGG